jgi:signal transduction histidine kinase/CheY-like chemotaxis protein
MNAGARRVCRWLLALPWLLVGAAGVLAAGEPEVPLALATATFEREGSAPREVVLPHTWALDGLSPSGKGRYSIEFDLAEKPEHPWALAGSRLASRHAIRLNGALVHRTLAADSNRSGVPVPILVDLPPALLRAGANRLDIDVDCDFRGGMATLAVGPTALVQPLHVGHEFWNVLVPQTMNVVATGLALLMLTIWLRRPSERELGFFCALMVAVSLRNVLSTGSGNTWHNAATDYTLYLLQVVTVALLCRFAIAFSRRDAPWLARTTDGVAALLILGGAVVARVHGMSGLREVAYPALLVLIVPSMWLLGVGARRSDRMRRVMLTLAIALLAGAAVHDYFFLRGLLPVTQRYWMPYVSPLALLVFAWTLLDRLVAALATVETLAVDLERRVAERTRELELSNAAKTRFLAAASHDLRQPVLSISLLTDLMREQPVPPATAPLLQRIGDSVQALNGLLKGLLDLSRFDAGAVQARPERVALCPLLEAVVGDERAAAEQKGLELRLRIPKWAVCTDPLLLEQIARNLVGNAVRYTERGGVLVAARRRGARVRLEDWDTGPGIATESQALVFEEFVQLDNPARERSRGLGLGLSLVRRAAAVLGAPLTLRSRPGRGSRFAVDLPFAGPVVAAIGTAVAPVAQLEGVRIWLVEDDPDVRETTRLCLERWGAGVRAFGDAGTCAAALAEGAAPEIFVTDQRLPDGSGLELAVRLHARHPAVPALVITGNSAPRDLALLGASGLPVLHKPYAAADLLAALGALRPAAVRTEARAVPLPPRPVSAS